jgi:hypothetical protein
MVVACCRGAIPPLDDPPQAAEAMHNDDSTRVDNLNTVWSELESSMCRVQMVSLSPLFLMRTRRLHVAANSTASSV